MKPIFIISGEKGSGKTTFLINVVALLKTSGFNVEGFVALHDLKKDFYRIKNLNTNEEAPLMERLAAFDKRPNHFKLFPEGVEAGSNCFKELLNNPPDIAVVDEIGGYELSGKLWSSGFTQLVESPVPLIFTVKERLLEKVVAKWRMEPVWIFRQADFSDPEEAFERIKKSL